MLKVKLGKALAYLSQTNINLTEAISELLSDIDLHKLAVEESIFQGFVNEWLLFEYHQPGQTTLIEQYYFKNPDNLSKAELSQLQQIIETQSVHIFQTYAPSQPPYVFIRSVMTGRKYKVYDRRLSISLDQIYGSFTGRIAKVGRTYHLVGSDPLVFPLRYSPRTILQMAKNQSAKTSQKDFVSFLVNNEPTNPAFNTINLTEKRKKTRIAYEHLARMFNVDIPFKALTDLVYNENYQHNFADYLPDLIKLGLPEQMCFENNELFQEIWNYFPHRIIGRKSPYEMHQEMHSERAG